MKIQYQDKEFYFNDLLYDNLQILVKAVEKKWDGLLMIDGIEGSAKTTLGGQVCIVLDPNFNLDHVVFTQEQFFELVDKAKPKTAILWDEFVFGGLSTEAMNKVQNALIKKMTTIRKKRLFIVLVMPWFFMMRPYFAIGRSRCLLHTFTPDGITRGRFTFFSYNKKQTLYHVGKKTYKYTVKSDFNGKFVDTFTWFWDENAYEKKKDIAIESISKEHIDKVADKYLGILQKTIYNMRHIDKAPWRHIKRITGQPESTLRRWSATTEDKLLDTDIVSIEKDVKDNG